MLILCAYAAACNALPSHLHQQTPLVPSHTADVPSREPSRTALAPAPQPPSISLTVGFWPVPPKILKGRAMPEPSQGCSWAWSEAPGGGARGVRSGPCRAEGPTLDPLSPGASVRSLDPWPSLTSPNSGALGQSGGAEASSEGTQLGQMFTDLRGGPRSGNGAQERTLAPDCPPIMPGRAQNGRTLRCSWHPFSKEAGRQGKAEGPEVIFSSPTFHGGPFFHHPDGWVGGLDLAEPAPRPALTAADRNQSGSRWPEITATSRREETKGMGVGRQREGGKAGSSP